MDRNEIPHDPCHLGVPSGVSKLIYEPVAYWHKTCTYLVSSLALSPNGPNELPLELRHLVVPLGVSKMISEPMVCLAQTMHQH
jgi:hypothetical protein